MREIRNSKGKLICRLDEEKVLIEIVCKGIRTIIHISPGNGTVIKEVPVQ